VRERNENTGQFTKDCCIIVLRFFSFGFSSVQRYKNIEDKRFYRLRILLINGKQIVEKLVETFL